MDGCAFEKQGIVMEQLRDGLMVRLSVPDACAGCGRKDCGLPRGKTEDVFVRCDAGAFAVGERVVVTLSHGKGFRAVFWAFLLPLGMVVAVLAAVYAGTGNEVMAGLSGLLALLPYYLLLWLLKSHMRQTFQFNIQKNR